MRILVLIVVGFIILCSGLVIESGIFKNPSQIGRSCILLQQTTTNEKQDTAGAPAPQNEHKEYKYLAPSFTGGSVSRFTRGPADFHADGGPVKSVTLGSVDPRSGFKFQCELSSIGAAIKKAALSEFDNRDYKNPEPLEILSPVHRADGSEILAMANKGFQNDALIQQKLQKPLDKFNWKSFDKEIADDGSQTARFEAFFKVEDTNDTVFKLIKTYTIIPGSYLLECKLTVKNLSDTEQKVRFNLAGPVGISREAIRSDMRKVVGGFVTSEGDIVSASQGILSSFFGKFRNELGLKDATAQYQQALRSGNAEQIKETRENLRIGHNLADRHRQAHFLWAATSNKYFTAIIRPVPDEGQNYCDWVSDRTGRFYNPDGDERGDTGDETVGLILKIACPTLAPVGQPGSAKTYNFQLYLGPKDRTLFQKNELYRKLGFLHTIDFMPCCCCPAYIIRPLAFGILAIMKWMYEFIGNYGVVIIILVFLVRLIMHPITKKSQVSMSKMGKLAPKAEEIRKKYAKNKAEMNKQLMALYREQGASPIMGMLPMMAQMPIWIALYSAIYASIELRGAPFLPFWITDLSAPDALVRFEAMTIPLLGWKLNSLNLLPILMGVAFYLQQKLMPSQAQASANPQVAQQQKMMMVMLPVLFPLMLYKAPSGLNLYIMSSVFAGVVEQYVIRKHIHEKEQKESKGLVAATSKTGGKVKKKKPKPFYRF
ncbi:MAG: YidC/Oxa1 family insertase periplasmic-domain containing protein [Sedimentisphaerales bacterium]